MLSEKYHKYNDSLKSDFLNIFDQTNHLWKDVKNKKIFLTGCTGFFGYWILRSFIKANKDLKLNSKIFVLTRKKNIKKSNIFKLCNDKAINFYIGDIRNFKYPKEKVLSKRVKSFIVDYKDSLILDIWIFLFSEIND